MAEDDDDRGFDDEEIIEEHEFDAEGWEEFPDDPEEASKILSALEGVLPDIVKRTLSAGVGGLSASEERIREALSDSKLPKEAVAYLVSQVDSTKKEFFRILSREIREALEEMDLGGELAKILTRLSLEANIEIRFSENEESKNRDAVKPKASGKVRVRRNADSEDEEAEGPSEDGA